MAAKICYKIVAGVVFSSQKTAFLRKNSYFQLKIHFNKHTWCTSVKYTYTLILCDAITPGYSACLVHAPSPGPSELAKLWSHHPTICLFNTVVTGSQLFINMRGLQRRHHL